MTPYDPTASRYMACRLAARRARMLWSGAPALIATKSTHPCRIALAEHRANLLSAATSTITPGATKENNVHPSH